MNYLSLLVAALLFFPSVESESPGPASSTTMEASAREQLPSYPLDTCLITGEKLDENAKSVMAKGTLVRVCCGKCAKRVQSAPADFAAKVNRAVIEDQLPSYPLQTCVLSGEPLGDKPHDVVAGTRLLLTCCATCGKKVAKDPASYLRKVDAALIRAQLMTYPTKTCPVSGEELGSMGDPINRLYGTKLVRLCCKGCVKSYENAPAKFVEVVYAKPKPTSRATSKPTSRKTK